MGSTLRCRSGGALWERFESEKKAQERNAGVEALGPGKEETLGFLATEKRCFRMFMDVPYMCVCVP